MSSEISRDELKSEFPELADVLDRGHNYEIAKRDCRVFNVSALQGVDHDLATKYLMAHIAVLQDQSRNHAPDRAPTSISVGEVSESYAGDAVQGGKVEEWLYTTRYGQRYKLLASGQMGAFQV